MTRGKINHGKILVAFFLKYQIKDHLKVLIAIYIQDLFFVNTVNKAYGFLGSDFNFNTHREKTCICDRNGKGFYLFVTIMKYSKL